MTGAINARRFRLFLKPASAIHAVVRRILVLVISPSDPEPGIRRLLAASGSAGTSPPAGLQPTGTRMDTGLWFRQGRVWTACTPAGLVLLAPGRRPYVQTIPFTRLQGSLYNAVTGEVLLAPAPASTVRRLRMDPDAGRRLIEAIHMQEGEP